MRIGRTDGASYVHDAGLAAVAAHSPDLIGFPVVSDDYGWARAWAARLKARCDIPIVFGNCHPTFHPREVLGRPEVDFVVRGEGELTLLELVEALGRGKDFSKILGLGYKDQGNVRINPMRPLIPDLDSLPFPDKDLHYGPMPYLNHGYITMLGRGCPYRCSFCDNNSSARLYAEHGLAKRWVRRRSPERAIAELLWARTRYCAGHFRFNDEDFGYDQRWLREFCALFKEKLGLRYFAWVSPNTIDAKTARLLAESGCDAVEMGIQSGSERMRTEVLHRRVSNRQMESAMRALREHGIRTDVDLILGLPTEAKADLDETVELLRRGRPWGTYAFWLQYYPSTEIYALAKERGLLPSGTAQARAAGIHREGDIPRDALARRYHAFITLVPLLPDAFIRLCQRWDLIRYCPAFFNTFLIAQLRRLLKGGVYNEFQVRGYHLLWRESGRFLAACFTRKSS